MNMADLVVTKGLVAQTNTKTPQLFRVSASTADLDSGVVDLTWRLVDNDGNASEPFANASVRYGAASEWLTSWAPLAHLVLGRIEALEQLAARGQASRFSRNMAYTLFASNLVTYADKYRGMQSVVMHELEGFADVELSTRESGGVWTVPPHFIDSVAHLAGFVMNCSDAIDTRANYCVTPGWKEMRFARPLVPGARYRSYVKMIPTVEDPTVYFGDVYIMQDGVIVGVVNGIQFRRYPRILLSRFFSPPDKMASLESKPNKASAPLAPAPAPAQAKPSVSVPKETPTRREHVVNTPAPAAETAAPPVESAAAADSITAKAIMLIANEAGLELSDMEDDASFAGLGVDSLMSLVIAEKFRTELGVKVGGSLFLDYETIGDLREWLDEYYS